MLILISFLCAFLAGGILMILFPGEQFEIVAILIFLLSLLIPSLENDTNKLGRVSLLSLLFTWGEYLSELIAEALVSEPLPNFFYIIRTLRQYSSMWDHPAKTLTLFLSAAIALIIMNEFVPKNLDFLGIYDLDDDLEDMDDDIEM